MFGFSDCLTEEQPMNKETSLYFRFFGRGWGSNQGLNRGYEDCFLLKLRQASSPLNLLVILSKGNITAHCSR